MDIIFLSYGNPDYLKYVLSQCVATNPKATVHLLGDDSNKGYKGVTHHMIDDYNYGTESFENNYEHLSTNNEKFERFCFERWYYINNLIQKYQMNNVVVMDSDVLVYDDVTGDMRFFDDYRMTLYFKEEGLMASAGQTFVKDPSILNEFCEFVTSSYLKKDQFFDKAKKHFEKLQKIGKNGGVCDMTYLYFFFLENKDSIFDLHNPLPNDHYYDLSYIHTVTPKVRFKANDKGMKFIDWENNIPYGYLLPGERKIKFQLLHFQGSQKEYIPNLITKKGVVYLYNIHYLAFKNKTKSFLSKWLRRS